ncbi:MAG: hypothetical protein M3463_20320 [Verrucomicrobiota bacterium]|nr:hypothetical protein [Verrucomicrobiota bacterium]
MEATRIPFKIPSIYAGHAKIEGLLILGTEHLAFEYRIIDTWLGALTSRIIKKTVKYGDLEKAEYRLGFFNPCLIFSARTLDAFDKLPHAEPTVLKIGVPWTRRKDLRSIISNINFYILVIDAHRCRDQLRSG